jgi:hypothetical protein
MSDEIRQAAELVLSKATIANKYDNAAQKVARAYLAENDDTAIDEAWLKSIAGSEWQDESINFASFDVPCIGMHVGMLEFRRSGDVQLCGPRLAHPPKTRGDVRRLCGALGIELQEAAR